MNYSAYAVFNLQLSCNVGTEALTEILTVLRTILNLRHADVGPSAIVIEDTTANIAFAEKIVSDLDRPARR